MAQRNEQRGANTGYAYPPSAKYQNVLYRKQHKEGARAFKGVATNISTTLSRAPVHQSKPTPTTPPLIFILALSPPPSLKDGAGTPPTKHKTALASTPNIKNTT